MFITNYITKIQALDKSIALMAEVRSQYPQTTVFSIIDIEEKNQQGDMDSMVALLGRVSDRVFFLGDRQLHLGACRYLGNSEGDEKACLIKDLTDSAVFEKSVDKSVGPTVRKLFFIPYSNTGSDQFFKVINFFKERGFLFISYQKSLHDHGLGFSTLYKRGPARFFPSLHNFFHSLGFGTDAGVDDSIPDPPNKAVAPAEAPPKNLAGPRFYSIDSSDIDIFLAFNREHKKLLQRRITPKRIELAGYQLTFDSWKKLIRTSSYCRKYEKRPDCLEVSVFTRGETPGRPSTENVVPHLMLEELLSDIFLALENCGREFRVRIKPHPIQDDCFLKKTIVSRGNATITYEPPSYLAATSDLVIATYSSTVIDALIFGVPSIEYFHENEFFRKKHPGGSPFPAFGVLAARDDVQFREQLKKVLEGKVRIPDIENKVGQKANLDFLHLGLQKK